MQYFAKESIVILGAVCGIFSALYVLFAEDYLCILCAGLVAVILSYLSFKICKLLLRKKNKEIRALAQRKKDLEEAVLGDARLSSGYNPDDSV